MRATEGDNARTGASFGYHVRRRRLALDLTQAALARRVGCSTATIKKIEQDQRRPSRTMAQRLADALEATDAERFVAVALGEVAVSRLGDATAPQPSGVAVQAPASMEAPDGEHGPAPEWLLRAAASERPSVVGRDQELAHLDTRLEAARAGEGALVFVSGEAGQGKTSLLAAFAERAQASVSDLVVTRGFGTAASGRGDPYLLWRDVLAMLLVDPGARWQADQLDGAQARALWRFAPAVAATLVERAPHLVDAVVPRASVAARLGPGAPAGAPPDVEASRDQLVSQLTTALLALAEQRVLLVLLDDLQWADAASIDLLFHLSRRILGARILIVGAYRSSEVASEAGGDASTDALRRVVLEVQRSSGSSAVDLGAIPQDEARRLCDALIDRAPNQLDATFRARLFELTQGHPLFVLELLQELRDRGDLVHDDAHGWVVGGQLDWEGLPVRVQAIVEQRLARISPGARRVLEVAAVIGEHFPSDVVATVAGEPEGQALRVLSRELVREQQLVVETGPADTGAGRATRFRFAHGLFQHHLYASLGAGERSHLHGRVADAIAVAAWDEDAVLPQLAHHVTASGDAERAVDLLVRAGDRARAVYAHGEAIHHYERAVALLRDRQDADRLGRTLMKLALSYQLGVQHERAQEAYDEAFTLLGREGTGPTPAMTATLRMIWRDPPSLDPTLGGYNLTAPITTQLFSNLVAYGEDLEVLPDLAARWEILDGGRRYVFHLRDDVVWSDGQPVTAHDVAFTYQLVFAPHRRDTVAPALLDAVRGARAIVRGDAPATELGVAALDDHTLSIELEEPTAYFIHNLAYYVLQPVPRHAAERHGEEWARPEHLVGNGPFLLRAWEHGRRMVLERNPRHHGSSSGNVARVELDLRPYADIEQLYLDDQLDVVTTWFTPTDTLERLHHRVPDETRIVPEFSTFMYSASPRPPLDDVRVRRAMSLATDREAIVRAAWPTTAVPAPGGLVPPGMPGHLDERPPFDPAEARRLLEDAGVTGDGPVVTVLATERIRLAAEALAAGWQTIGLPCEVATVTDLTSFGQHQEAHVALGGWFADYPDPDTFLRVCVLTDREPDQTRPGYADLLEQAARSPDQRQRMAYYAEAERILAADAWVVPFAHRRTVVIAKPWVRDFRTLKVKHPGFWKDVTIGSRRP